MTLTDLPSLASAAENVRFSTSDEIRPVLEAACAENPDVAKYHEIGASEEGRPISAVTLGTGAVHVSLLAGAHADEPVGPETLRLFILGVLYGRRRFETVLRRYRFSIVPHINPDGEARNRPWIERWPDAAAFIRHAVREKPGRDIEFGYPAMRKENAAVSAFLTNSAPHRLHMSLHGMSFAEGGMLLIERSWIDRTVRLRAAYRRTLKESGVGVHDHDRGGEKGFEYIGPGFWTTPRGAAMRAHFETEGDHETASLFHDSSMEFVQSLGAFPLCLVTEIPLFIVGNPLIRSRPCYAGAHLAWKERLPEVKLALGKGADIEEAAFPFTVRPVPIAATLRLHLRALQLGLECVR